MTSFSKERLLSVCFNVVNYPFKKGVAYSPETIMSTQRMQENASVGLAMMGAVFGAPYGATASFAAATIGYAGGHYIVGAVVEHTLK